MRRKQGGQVHQPTGSGQVLTYCSTIYSDYLSERVWPEIFELLTPYNAELVNRSLLIHLKHDCFLGLDLS